MTLTISQNRVLKIPIISLKVGWQPQDHASNTLTHPKYEDEPKPFDLNFTVFADNNKCPATQHNRDTDMLYESIFKTMMKIIQVRSQPSVTKKMQCYCRFLHIAYSKVWQNR